MLGKKKLISLSIALLYTVGTVAFADTAIIPGNIDENNKITLTITVDKTDAADRNGMLTIFRQEISSDDLKANNVEKGQLFLADVITVPANASKVTYTINMDGEESGMYYAKVNVGGGKAYQEFSYMDKQALDALLEELSEKTTADTMYDFFTAHKLELMIDIENEYTDYSEEDKKEALNNVLSRSYSSVQEIKERFEDGLIIVDINKSDADGIKRIIEENDGIFGINLSDGSEYSMLDDAAKAAVWTGLEDKRFKNAEEVKAAVDESVKDNYVSMLLAEIKSSTAENVMDIFTESAIKALGLETETNVYPVYIRDNEKATAKLAELIAGADWSTAAEAAAEFKESSIAAAYQTLSDYAKYTELINMTKTDVGLSGVYFTWNSDTPRYEVNKLMIAVAPSLINYSTIKAKFDECAAGIKYPSSAVTTGSGGASTKSSSSTSGVGMSSMNTAGNMPHTGDIVNTNEAYYCDLDGFDWAKSSIYNLSSKGIIHGTGDNYYEPARLIKKEEFAKMLVEAFDISARNTVIELTDVAHDAWYYDYVAALYSNEIVKGNGDSTFGSGLDVSREDMCVMMSNVLKFKGYTLEQSAERVNYRDEEHISMYAKEAVEEMQLAGAVNGMGDGVFEPKTPTNRAMAAVVLERVLKLIGRI